MTRLFGGALIVLMLAQDWQGVDTAQAVLMGLVIGVGAMFVVVGTIYASEEEEE